MGREVEFYRATQLRKPKFAGLPNRDESIQISIYAEWVEELAKAFGVEIEAQIPRGIMDGTAAQTLFVQIERQLARVHARNLSDLEANADSEWLRLNGDWQGRVSSYIAHIRGAISNASIAERLRERILARLNTLQEEVDRNRTRLASVTETWLMVTEAMAKGAKNLDPVVRLLERIGGAFSSVRSARLEADEPPLLPAPDSLGLAAPSDAASEP
jgi:hypothetical protein